MDLTGDNLISGLNSLLSSGTSIGTAIESYKQAKKLAEYQYSKQIEMWDKQNAYNLPSAQMGRLRDAGLNPNLVYGTGSVVGNTTSDYPKYEAPDTSMFQKISPPDINGALTVASNIRLQNAQSDNLEAQTKNTLTRLPLNELEIGIQKQELIRKQYENAKTEAEKDYWRELARNNMQLIESQVTLTRTNSFKADSERLFVDKQKETEDVKQDLIRAQTNVQKVLPGYYQSLISQAYSFVERNRYLNSFTKSQEAEVYARIGLLIKDAQLRGKQIERADIENYIRSSLAYQGVDFENRGFQNTGLSIDELLKALKLLGIIK